MKDAAENHRAFYLRAVEDLRPISRGEFGASGIAEQLVFVVDPDSRSSIGIEEVRFGIESALDAKAA